MIVIAAYVALLGLSIYLFVSIRNDHVPAIKMSQLSGWPKFAWVSAIVLLVAGLALLVLPAMIGLLSAADSGSPAGPQPPYWVAIAISGPFVLLVPCFVMAFWRPESAALLMMATAVAAPTVPFIQAILPLAESVDPSNQAAFLAPILLAAVFSVPALGISFLLWSSSRGLSSKPQPAAGDAPDDSTTRATSSG